MELVTKNPYNTLAQDYRRSFNIPDATHWELLAAATSTAITIPGGIKLLQVASDDTILVSPNPITSIPTAGSPVTGSLFMNPPMIILQDETTIYVWSRQICDVVINFYQG